jgi:hypothetical protein
MSMMYLGYYLLCTLVVFMFFAVVYKIIKAVRYEKRMKKWRKDIEVGEDVSVSTSTISGCITGKILKSNLDGTFDVVITVSDHRLYIYDKKVH